MKKRILVVEDEARIREVVEYAFSREGWDTVLVADGATGLAEAGSGRFDAAVLDVMLPEMDGLELCRRLRAQRAAAARLPVLFLSARAEEIDRIVGLEIGGDDYLTKPFSPRELVARMRALLRRSELANEAPPPALVPASAPTERAGGAAVAIDAARHEVRCRGQLVQLTHTELTLLAALFERPGVVLTRGQLMQRCARDEEADVTERTVDTHIKRIRAKFRAFKLDPILTVHGVGYRASPEGEGGSEGA